MYGVILQSHKAIGDLLSLLAIFVSECIKPIPPVSPIYLIERIQTNMRK